MIVIVFRQHTFLLRILLVFTIAFPTIFGISGCSTKKNTAVNRFYHNLTTRYNIYFNARERFKEGVIKVEDGYKENYKRLLPIFVYGDESAANSIFPDMDVVIEKCSKAIDRHSMEFKGKEMNKWIDESYFLMGKAYFYKQDFAPAKEMFEFTAKQYKETESRWDAMIWLARAHIQTEKYDDAKKILKLLDNARDLPDDRVAEFRKVYADYYIKLGKYDQAVNEIAVAIPLTKKKKMRTRLTFILAQLYQNQEDGFMSRKNYEKVIKMNPPYEMTFYAKINMALGFNSGAGGSLAIKEILREMLKDVKNEDFQDQIYYALAELEIKENNEEEGLNLYKKSAQSSVNDNDQKGLSYLKVAEIYYKNKEFELAQKYYDSTATYINKDIENYEEIVMLKNSLTKMVYNLNIIKREDSLQAMVQLPKEELEKIIEEKIQKIIDEENRKKEEEYYQNMDRQTALMNQMQGGGGMNAAGGGDGKTWYFYNPGTVGAGVTEFKKIWGNRKNEDNWRRSDKDSGGFGDFDFDDLEADAEPPPTISELKSKAYYLKNLPDNEEKLKESNKKIAKAHYELGKVYKELMEDYEKAIVAFEELLDRFDTSAHHPSAYYQLHMIGVITNDIALQNKYKNKLKEDYPNSDFTKLAENPNYFENQEEISEEVTDFYKKTLDFYQRGYYTQVVASCQESETLFPNNHLASKFKFLKAISMGRSTDKETVIAELEAVQKLFPQSDEAKEAKEIVDILKNPRTVEAAEEPDFIPDFQKFKVNFESNHTVLVILPESEVPAASAKVAISNFNREFFRSTPLNVSSIILNKEEVMISVKLFKNKEKAMEYYRAFKVNTKHLQAINESNAVVMVISYDNYPTFYKGKNVPEYEAFFKAVYIDGVLPENNESEGSDGSKKGRN